MSIVAHMEAASDGHQGAHPDRDPIRNRLLAVVLVERTCGFAGPTHRRTNLPPLRTGCAGGVDSGDHLIVSEAFVLEPVGDLAKRLDWKLGRLPPVATGCRSGQVPLQPDLLVAVVHR